MIFSCKDCQQRHPGCHSKCETYKKEKAEHEAQLEAARRERNVKQGLYEQRTAAISKASKRMKRN